MQRPISFLVVSFVLLLLPTRSSAGEPKLEVRLELSVKEFDPAEPGKAVLKCIVKNASKENVILTSAREDKSGLQLTLFGKGKSSRFELRHSESAPIKVEVPAGAEKVVHEWPLAVLLDAKKGGRWDWMARPAPPPSPIHLLRGKGLETEASFWVTIGRDKGVVGSSKVVLKVKGK